MFLLVSDDSLKQREFFYVVILKIIHLNIFAAERVRLPYSDCTFVAIIMQRPKRMLHTVIGVLSASTIFVHIISFLARFRGEKITALELYCDIFYNLCPKYFYY